MQYKGNFTNSASVYKLEKAIAYHHSHFVQYDHSWIEKELITFGQSTEKNANFKKAQTSLISIHKFDHNSLNTMNIFKI